MLRVVHQLLDRRGREVLPVLHVQAVAPRPLAPGEAALERADLVQAGEHPLVQRVLRMLPLLVLVVLRVVLSVLLLVPVVSGGPGVGSRDRGRRGHCLCPGMLTPDLAVFVLGLVVLRGSDPEVRVGRHAPLVLLSPVLRLRV